ncbi:hypothetical protein Tco_0918790 [Tanacetum coccineum]
MTYDEYEQELNKRTQGDEEPWSENGVQYQLCDHICEPYRFKNGNAKWPICTSDIDRFCNGGKLPGMVQVGTMTYFQDHSWYDNLADGKLKDETLALKTKIERAWGDATPGNVGGRNYEASNVGGTQGHDDDKDEPTPELLVFRKPFDNTESRWQNQSLVTTYLLLRKASSQATSMEK